MLYGNELNRSKKKVNTFQKNSSTKTRLTFNLAKILTFLFIR